MEQGSRLGSTLDGLAGREGKGELRLRLLGGFEVRVAGRPLHQEKWRLRKAKSLIKLLALAPGTRLHREQIHDWLWPEMEPDTAANNLHKALHVARRILEPGLAAGAPSAYLAWRGDLVSLEAPGRLWIDTAAFVQAAAGARRAPDVGAYGAALALYRGDLLPEDRYEDWAAAPRDTLSRLHLDLLDELAQLHETRGDYALAIGALQQIVSHDPLHEAAHVRLMRLYMQTGRRSDALRQYRQLSSLLRQELDAEPEEATQRLYHEIAGACPGGGLELACTTLEALTPRPGGPRGPRHNLPLPRTSRVGRARECELVRRLLAQPGAQLVTLTGPPGIGKTRLALAVASTEVERFPDGVCFVPLAPVTAAERVIPTIAQTVSHTLGAPPVATGTTLEALTASLRRRSLLLVLDNFEHLLPAAPLLAELLTACHGVQALVTSRAALRLCGEQVVLVPTLPLPPPVPPGAPPGAPGVEALMRYEAVQLFVERARAAGTDFRLTAGDAPVVAEICRRLDGLPLAIELAAARLRVLPPRAMLACLTQRGVGYEEAGDLHPDALAFLTGGPCDLPRRQQTLRGAIAWSYDLLDACQQRLFRLLGTFAGGCTLHDLAALAAPPSAGAAATCEAPAAGGPQAGRVAPDLVDDLQSLVDHNLVRAEVQADGTPRFVMLETIREYALDRCGERGELPAIRRRHAAHFLRLAERAEPALYGPQQLAWLDRLEREHDNLRAALAWAAATAAALPTVAVAGAAGAPREAPATPEEGLELGLRLGAALAPFWLRRSHLAEGRAWLRRLLALPRAGALAHGGSGGRLAAAQARALGAAGFLAHVHSDLPAALPLLESCLALARKIGAPRILAQATGRLAYLQLHRHRDDAAVTLAEESLSLCRALGDSWGTAFALRTLGRAALRRGDGTGMATLERSLAIFRAVGDRWGIAWTLRRVGQEAFDRDDLTRAAACWEERLVLAKEIGDQAAAAHALDWLGTVARLRGDYRQAETCYAASMRLHQEAGDATMTAWTLHHRATLALARGNPTGAGALYQECLTRYRELTCPPGIAWSLEGLAASLMAQGQPAPAMRLAGAAQAIRLAAGTPPTPVERIELDPWLPRAQEALGELAAVTLAEGRTLTLDQAMAQLPAGRTAGARIYEEE